MNHRSLLAVAGALLLGGCDTTATPAPATAGSPGGGASDTAGRGSAGDAAGNPGLDGGGGAAAASNGGGAPSSAGDATAPSEAGSAGEENEPCADVALADLEVFSPGGWDPLGYPPYALDGCSLVYVAPAPGGGALYLRDLSSGHDVRLDSADSQPRRPAVSGELVAWEASDGDKSQVRLRFRGVTTTLSGDFDHAAEPRVTDDALVFTAFLGPAPTDDSDVYLYDVARAELSPIAAGPGQQRFADVSASHVAVTDFSEDPDGYFDEHGALADVVLVDRRTGVSTARQLTGKQAFPLLGSDGVLVYLDWGNVHPEPKFSQFWLKYGQVAASPSLDASVTVEQIHTDPAYVRPSLRGKSVDFVDTREQVVGLYRASVGSLQPPVDARFSGSPQLYGPVAADALTLVSKPVTATSWALFSVPR